MAEREAKLTITAEDKTRTAILSAKQNLNSLEREINQLKRGFGDLGGSISKPFVLLRSHLAGLAAGLSVAGFAAWVKSGIDAADTMNALSKKTGVAVEDLSTLKYAVEQSGGSFDALSTGLVYFEKVLAKAGISGKEATERLLQVAEAIQKTEDPAKRVQIAVAAFGKSAGPELVEFLSQGSASIEELRQRARDLGLEMSGKTAQAADDFNDKLATLKTQATAAAVALGGGFVAALSDVNNKGISPETLQNLESFGTLLGEIARWALAAGAGMANFGANVESALDKFRSWVRSGAGGATKHVLSGEPLAPVKTIPQPELTIDISAPAARQPWVPAGAGGGASRRGGGGGRAVNMALENAKAQVSILKDQLDREQKILDQQLEDHLISYREYYASLRILQEQEIDNQLAVKRLELASAKDKGEAARITAEITVLEQKRGDAAADATRKQAKAYKDLADELNDVRARLLELQGLTAEARGIALEKEFRDLMAKLEAEGDETGQAMVQKLINVETAKAELDQLESVFNAAMTRLSAREQAINVQLNAGLISEYDARQRIVQAHREVTAEVEGLIPKMETLANETNNPQIIAGIESMKAQFLEASTIVDDVALSINKSMTEGFADAFTDVITGAKDASVAFREFAKNVVRDIANILSQRLAQRLFGSVGGAGGMAGGGLGGLVSMAAGVLHGGGIVGQSGTTRRVPRIVFAGAPRLHDGAVLGLRPGEVPAILQQGEEVLARGDPRNIRNQGRPWVENRTVNIQVRPDTLSMTLRDWLDGYLASEVAKR